MYVGEQTCIKCFGGETLGRLPVGKARRRWEDKIKMVVREVEWRGMEWIELSQDWNRWQTVVNTVMNLRVPYSSGKFLSS